jgi:hypothetical protein
MSMPSRRASDFDIVRRFPVLRGAGSTANGVFQRNSASYDEKKDNNVTRQSTSAAAPDAILDRVGTPLRHSFEGMPEQLVYGLFEKQKNVRYVMPQIWSPPNTRQVTQRMRDLCTQFYLMLHCTSPSWVSNVDRAANLILRCLSLGS